VKGKTVNTNLLHNLLNLAIAIIAALTAFDWTAIFGPQTGAMIISGLGFAKLAINFFRDGPAGMTKPQPPVEK
jgi:hypothetical protein